MKKWMVVLCLLSLVSTISRAGGQQDMTKETFIKKCLGEISTQASANLKLSCRAAKPQEQASLDELGYDFNDVSISKAKVGTFEYNGQTYWQSVSVRMGGSFFFPFVLSIGCSQGAENPTKIRLPSEFGIFAGTQSLIDANDGFYLKCE